MVLVRNEQSGVLAQFHAASLRVGYREESELRIEYWDSAAAFQPGTDRDIRKTT